MEVIAIGALVGGAIAGVLALPVVWALTKLGVLDKDAWGTERYFRKGRR